MNFLVYLCHNSPKTILLTMPAALAMLKYVKSSQCSICETFAADYHVHYIDSPAFFLGSADFFCRRSCSK